MLRAILLDFYGTVVEEDDKILAYICDEIAKASPKDITSRDVGSYWGQVFGEMCSKSYGSTFCSQKKLEELSLRKVLSHFNVDLDSGKLSRILFDYWAKPTIFPESKNVLSKCGVPICIVTNIDNVELISALTHNDLTFDYVVTSEDCGAYKPRPEPFEKALSLLNLSNEEVLHVGDSISSDVHGAKAMGITTLWINRKKRSFPAKEKQPDYISPDLNGILDVLQQN